MKVLIDSFAAAACRAGYLAIAGHGSMVTPAQLVIAACIASIITIVFVTGAHAFVIAVCACFINLIAWVCMAYLIGMLGVLTMHVAWLKALVLARGSTLLVPHIVAASVAVAALVVLTLTTPIVASHTAQLVGLAIVCKIA